MQALPHNCSSLDKAIIGCMSAYVPYRDYNVCVERVWFDKKFRPVDYWRAPTSGELEENPSKEEWERRLRFELALLKLKEKEVNEKYERE